ncbi:MAG TPA: YihY/virulence factor BrkB family protein [Rubrivivax sp.]|nr:YihY/virulence factor BrkB family protein [Rubrivivax sp.]
MRPLWRLLREAVSAWSDDYAPSMGAALAYYTLFSVAPLLLIVISVAGLVFGEDAARGEIMEQLQGLIGIESAKAVEALLQSVNKPSKGVLGTVVGIVVLIIGATTVFGELQDAMDRIWRQRPPPGRGIVRLLQTRLLSLGLVLGIGFLLMVSLVVSAALAALGRWWAPWFGEGLLLLADTLNFVVSLLLMTAIFAQIFKWLPRVRLAWRDVWIGAAITSLLFTVGKTLIGYYIGRSAIASTFGAAASLVVLLVWVYYSAQIFLLGAEFTRAYAMRYGSQRGRMETGSSEQARVPVRPAA